MGARKNGRAFFLAPIYFLAHLFPTQAILASDWFKKNPLLSQFTHAHYRDTIPLIKPVFGNFPHRDFQGLLICCRGHVAESKTVRKKPLCDQWQVDLFIFVKCLDYICIQGRSTLQLLEITMFGNVPKEFSTPLGTHDPA